MILIGEKLNSAIKKTRTAFDSRDEKTVIEIIRAQSASSYLDINTAMANNELDTLEWVIKLALENSQCGICADSADFEVTKAALKWTDDRPTLINSVTATERLDELGDAVRESRASLVALPCGKGYNSESIDGIVSASDEIIRKCDFYGIAHDKIFLDILIRAVATDDTAGKRAIDTLKALKERHPDTKTVCGLSNISFGLPNRVSLNCAFLASAVMSGLDSAILDVTNEKILDTLYASEALSGKDEYCIEYIGYERAKSKT